MPKISIIVPCYNQAQYLDEALQSVLEQTYTNWECIIVNDGSPDDTEEIAKIWTKKDSRFIYLKKENGGLSNARNAGIDLATGEYILPLDADDKIGKEYIEFALVEFKKDESLKLVYCKAEKFGEEKGLWDLPSYSLKVLALNNIIFCSAIYKKTSWILANGYDSQMALGWEDWEFWIAILKDGGKVFRLKQTFFYYRVKRESMILKMEPKTEFLYREYIVKKHSIFYLEICRKIIQEENSLLIKLRSKKIVSSIFTKLFFGFELFKIKDLNL
jgi:glycosyltransferase involved in cell wall biosynthesis